MLLAVIASPASLQLGWSLILAAFVSGAVIGLKFHRDDWLGGYASFSRRMLRLGHIALAALGVLNILFAIMPAGLLLPRNALVAALLLAIGAVLMPLICFLSAWRECHRRLFFLPVLALLGGVVSILLGVQS